MGACDRQGEQHILTLAAHFLQGDLMQPLCALALLPAGQKHVPSPLFQRTSGIQLPPVTAHHAKIPHRPLPSPLYFLDHSYSMGARSFLCGRLPCIFLPSLWLRT